MSTLIGHRASDEVYLEIALRYAQIHATDPATQNGAVLVAPTGAVLALGANHFPRGVRESPERWERPAKYQWVEHAERNAIFDAARRGVPTQGLTLYCPWFACADCARAIVQAGIKEVVGLELGDDPVSLRWKASCDVGDTILREGGVTVRRLAVKIGGVPVRRDSQLVEP